jgi:DNA replication protein DnaC
MEARVVQWKRGSDDTRSPMEFFAAMHEESNRLEAIKREQERVERFVLSVPYRYRGKSFEDYFSKSPEQTRVKQLTQRYAETFKDRLQDGMNLIFTGKPGTGKTCLSLIMFQAIVKSGFSAHYESSLLFLQNMLDMKFKSKSDFECKLESLTKIDFLIIDEVTESINAHGRPSEIEKQLFLKVINARYENRRCTLVITNRNEDGIVDRLGMPIYGRLKEGGLMFAFNWESFRN